MRTRVKLQDNQLYASNFVRRLDSWRGQLRASLSPKITRGHSYIMASFMEDLFAQYLEKILGNGVDFILVDTAINIDGKTVRPDIILIKNDSIIGFFDCKVSLWDRGGVAKMATTYTEYLNKIRSRGGKVKVTSVFPEGSKPANDGTSNKSEQKEYLVDDSACWDVVVAHVWGNSNNGKVKEQIDAWNSDDTHVETRIWHMVNHVAKKDNKEFRQICNENVFMEIGKRILGVDALSLECKNSDYAQSVFQRGDLLQVNDSNIGYFTKKVVIGRIFGIKIPKMYMRSGVRINDTYELSFMNEDGPWKNTIRDDGSIEMVPKMSSDWYDAVLPDKERDKKLIVFYRTQGKYRFMGVFEWSPECYSNLRCKVLQKVSDTISKSDLA